MSDVAAVFHFKVLKEEEDHEHPDEITWSINNSKHEICQPALAAINLRDVLPHCAQVKSKALKQASNANHQGPSLCRVFPRTLSLVLDAVWNQIIADADADPL